MKKRKSVKHLAQEVFGLVETDQGYGFISEGWGCLTRKNFLAHVRQAEKHTRSASNKLKKFLRENDGDGEKKIKGSHPI